MTPAFDLHTVVERIVPIEQRSRGIFPRDLEDHAIGELGASVVYIDGLTPTKADRYFHALTGRPVTTADKRPLRGCLIAFQDAAFIFLNESEPEASRRFVLAHEMAHLEGHHRASRRLAVERLGSGILSVLDGMRAPTVEEKLGSILGGCPIGVFRDAMVREDGSPVTVATDVMEIEADRAAFEALAPPREVVAACRRAGAALDRSNIIDAMVESFGLTPHDAAHHAPAVLRPGRSVPRTWVNSLREALESGFDERTTI